MFEKSAHHFALKESVPFGIIRIGIRTAHTLMPAPLRIFRTSTDAMRFVKRFAKDFAKEAICFLN